MEQPEPGSGAETTADPPPRADPGRGPIWWLAGGLALLLLGAGGLLAWRALRAGQVETLLAETSAAIDRGDLPAAADKLSAAEALGPDAPPLAWMRGRLAHARGDEDLASRHLARAWEAAARQPWPARKLALVALEYAAALDARGERDKALAVNDRALAAALDLLDTHLDREDLGPGGMPLEGVSRPADPGVRAAIALLEQRGAVAAARAEGLLRQGEQEAAERTLASAEARISGSVCTGTHRVYCRGGRRELLDLAMAPIAEARTRERIGRALALVKAGRFEEALEVAEEARVDASEERGARAGGAGGRGVAREAAEVEYAVRVAWGAELEKKKAWKQAHDQYAEAAALQATAGLRREDHEAGLARLSAITGLLDETSSVLDGLAGIGIGDEARKRFHERLEADPLNPRVYAEEALARARASRLAAEPEQRREIGEQVRRYLKAGEKVAPGNHMAGFYEGVTRFLAGYPREGLEAMQRAYDGGYRDRAAELYLAESLGLRGRTRQAARHWKRAWEARKTDTYVGRRAIEAMLAAGDLGGARALLLVLLEERAMDEHLIEAQVMVHFHSGDKKALRRVLALDAWRFSASDPDPVVRAHRIAEAVYNRLGERLRGEILRPGEELIDRIYGYAIPADAQGMIAGKRIQSAALLLTDRGMVILRWDASQDYREQVRQGVSLARKAFRLGAKLGGEWTGLNLGDGIEKLAQVLDLLPEADHAPKAGSDTLGDSADLVIASLDLFETLRRDIELQVKPEEVRAHRVVRGDILAYDLVPVRPADGLYALFARTRDGRSLWHTDSERLFIHTTRPGRVRMYMDRYLARRAGAPPGETPRPSGAKGGGRGGQAVGPPTP